MNLVNTQTLLLAAVLNLLCCSSCGVLTALWRLTPDTNDYKHSPSRRIEPAAETFNFNYPASENQLGQQLHLSLHFVQNLVTLDEFVRQYGTEAFLIIRNDTILYENYPNGHHASKPVTTFSLAKAIMATLVGMAIQDGYLKNLQQPVTDFLPEFEERGFSEVTLHDLLRHTSGIRFSKSLINLNSDQVQFYYGHRLRKRMANRSLKHPPGTHFDYHSANTQLLAHILEKATGRRLSEYLEEKIWQPLGMEGEAFWSLDRKGEEGVEKAFCCLQARALDFARIGRLWLNQGNWNGRQALPPFWMDTLMAPGPVPTGAYHCGFTLCSSPCRAYMASGLMGQIIYVAPEKQLLILRFGEHKKEYSINFWKDIMQQVADGL